MAKFVVVVELTRGNGTGIEQVEALDAREARDRAYRATFGYDYDGSGYHPEAKRTTTIRGESV